MGLLSKVYHKRKLVPSMGAAKKVTIATILNSLPVSPEKVAAAVTINGSQVKAF